MREETVGGIEFQNVMLIYHEYVNYLTTKFCLLPDLIFEETRVECLINRKT